MRLYIGSIARQQSEYADPEELGLIGEIKVSRLLNSDLFAKGEQKIIKNLVLVDKNGDTHQIDHVVIRHNGIFAIETKNISGTIYGSIDDSEWFSVFRKGKKYAFYNPLKQNAAHVRYIEEVLSNQYKVHSVVVMVNGNGKRLKIPNVVNYIDLVDYLQGFNDGTHYSDQQIEYAYATLDKADAHISRYEHARRLAARQNNPAALINHED